MHQLQRRENKISNLFLFLTTLKYYLSFNCEWEIDIRRNTAGWNLQLVLFQYSTHFNIECTGTQNLHEDPAMNGIKNYKNNLSILKTELNVLS